MLDAKEFFEYNGKHTVTVSLDGRFEQEFTLEELYQVFAERLKVELAKPKTKLSKTLNKALT